MALDVLALKATLGIDSKEYDKGLKDAEGGLQTFGKGVENMVSVAKKAIAAIGIGAAVKKGIDAFKSGVANVAAIGDNIDKASQKLGISAKAYQEWDAILQHSGASIDSMGIGMKTLANKALEGSDAFKKLGISQKKAASMSREELFSKTITALQNVQDANQKAALAQELFGRSAMELGPLLNTSAEDTQAMREQVNALGGVLSDEAVKASAAYQDSLQDMTTAIDGFKRGFFAKFLPSLTKIMDGIGGIFSTGKGKVKLKRGVAAFVDTLTTEGPKFLAKGVEIAATIGEGIIKAIPKAAENIAGMLGKGLNRIAFYLPDVTQKVVNWALGLAKRSGELIPKIGKALAEKIPNLLGSIKSSISKVFDGLSTLLAGWMGDSDIAGYLFGGFVRARDNISEALSAIGEALKGVWDILVSAYEKTIKPIISFFIADFIINTLPKVTEIFKTIAQVMRDEVVPWVADKWTNVIQPAINNAFTAIAGFWTGTLRPAFEDIWTYVSETLIPTLIEKWGEFKETAKTVFEAVVGFWNDPLKPAFEDIYKYVVKTLIPTLIEWWDTKFKPTVETVFTAIAGFWNDTLRPAFEDIYNYVVTDLIPTLIVWWEYYLQPAVEKVFTAIAGFWNDTLRPAFEDIYNFVIKDLIPTLIVWWEYYLQPAIETVFKAIAGFWEDILKKAFEEIHTTVEELMPKLKTAWEGFQTIVENVFTAVKEFWDKTLEPVFKDVRDFIVRTLIPKFGTLVKTIGDFISETLVPLGVAFSDFLADSGNPVTTWLSDTFITAWEGVKTELTAIIDFLTNVFSGQWGDAWDALVTLVSTPFNTLGEILKEPINAVIDMLNALISKVESTVNKIIRGLNKALTVHQDPIYDYFTGKEVPGSGYDISPNLKPVSWGRIQKLASGGVLRNGGRAIVGEYAPELLQMVGNQAVVTPLSSTPGRFPGGGQEVIVPRDQGRDITIILELDRQQFGKVVYKANNEETQRVGVRMATGGAY